MYNAPALKKALEIIRLIVRENKPLGVAGIYTDAFLEQEHYLRYSQIPRGRGVRGQSQSDQEVHMAGGELFELSKRVLRATDLTSIAQPFLEKLVEQVDETVFLGVREDEIVKVLEVVEPRKELKYPLLWAHALLSLPASSEKSFSPLWRTKKSSPFSPRHKLPQYTGNSIIDPANFLEEIEKQGYRGTRSNRGISYGNEGGSNAHILRTLTCWRYLGRRFHKFP